MRITSFSFLFFLKLVLFSQNTCENIPIISLDSLSNFSSTSEIEYFKVQEDSIFDSFSFTSGFQSVNLYFDTCNSLNKLVLDSNGLVIPTDEMINSTLELRALANLEDDNKVLGPVTIASESSIVSPGTISYFTPRLSYALFVQSVNWKVYLA